MQGELVGISSTASKCGYKTVRSQPLPRQRRCALKLQAARRGSSEQEEEKQNAGRFGGFTKRIGGARKPKMEDLQATQRIKSGQSKGNLLARFGTSTSRRKDANTVFVAGGSGRLGARIVRELLNRGFKVRVGVRNQAQGQSLLKTAIDFGLITSEAGRKAQIVEFDLLNESTISPAIGNASKVVSAIGAAESQPFDVGAPKRIDGDAAIRLVNVAAESGVQQFVMVTALGTGKFGWPAGLLNLFWGILVWKKRAEEALEASGMQYTIVRPGGMEVPRDDHKLTHNVILGSRDSTFGGTVSRLQVAELIGTSLTDPTLGANKVLEVWSETTAPKLDYESLLRAQPNEKASEAENAAASQEARGPEIDKDEVPAPPKRRPTPKASARQQAPVEAKPAAAQQPERPKNAAELRREEERQYEEEQRRQWQARQQEEAAAAEAARPQPKPRDLEAEAQRARERAEANDRFAKTRAETEARVQAEAEEERRKASEQQSARREADKRARLEASDKEAASAKEKVEKQLLSRNNVSKVISPPNTGLSKAEQDLGSQQPSKKLPGATPGKGERRSGASQDAQASAASSQQEAAAWIGKWRQNGASSNGSSSSNGSTPSKAAAKAPVASSASSNGAGPSSASDNGSGKLENAKQARGWIQNWRNRQ